MKRIVECIPNFSEGRRSEVVEEIVNAIRSVAGAVILDYELDADHNRSVITFVAEPHIVTEAAFRAVAKASELIDLNNHQGAHPRIGATDVVPFVPIQGVTMAECVEVARQCGERIATELAIPVYLYEKAALLPERENLANLRKGQFEGLRNEIATNPKRHPDYGQPAVHPTAGAIAVGARRPLIAYNINLNTNRLEVADKIARAVRNLSGGFRYVKALGIELKERGVVQVSMNLVNYEESPIFRVFEMVKREAQRYGVTVLGSELIGLVPQAALDMCADFYLQIENFNRNQILENRLQNALSEVEVDNQSPVIPTPEAAPPISGVAAEPAAPASLADSIGSFPAMVASDAPTPGGGSVAAISGLLAASLAEMVCRLTTGRKRYAVVEAEIQSVLAQLPPLSEQLKQAVDDDAASFDQVMLAYKKPKETLAEQAERAAAIEAATKGATEAPLHTAEISLQVLTLLGKLAEIGNRNAFSDVAVGAQMALAAVRGAYYNVSTNLPVLQDEVFKRETLMRIQGIVGQAISLATAVEQEFLKETLRK